MPALSGRFVVPNTVDVDAPERFDELIAQRSVRQRSADAALICFLGMNMSPQLFCELYIDTDESGQELEDAVNQAVRDAFGNLSIEVITYRNEDFEPSARQRSPYSAIECSRYCAEVAARGTPIDRADEFQSGTAALVRVLREGGRFVSASCDFEEVIVDLTGWSWSRDKPEPPGR